MKNFIIALLICVGCCLAENICLDNAYEIINSLEKCEIVGKDADGTLFICGSNLQFINPSRKNIVLEYAAQGNHYYAIIDLEINKCSCWAVDEFGIKIPYSDSITKLSEKETWDIYSYFKKILHNKKEKDCPSSWQDEYGRCKAGWNS